MGTAIEREEFSPEEYARFALRLREGLEALRLLLRRPGFGDGPASVGVELELSLVREDGRPLPCNLEVMEELEDPRLTPELDRFNLECNGRPLPFRGRAFEGLRRELDPLLEAVRAGARRRGGDVVLVGILPTLTRDDLGPGAMTDVARFRALSAGIRRLRSGPVRLHIDGDDPLLAEVDDVTWEGAATSLQIHLRVPPSEFAATHAAAQLATAPVLAAAGNAPLFLGRRLWQETRIALFKQAVDERGRRAGGWRHAARVSFGHGWLRGDAHEPFAESVALHPPLLPVVSDEDPLACARAGGVPRLEELRLHQGTVWRWNRAIYDPAEGGHLRLELRALPAGPGATDMMANAAFLLGLTLALREEIPWMLFAMPFEHAQHNFYRAAQQGLAAELLWPSATPPSPVPEAADALVLRLLPLAERGLVAAGIDAGEAQSLLRVIAERVSSGQTGARWQRSMLDRLERGGDRPGALRLMLQRYREEAATGRPVHEWSLRP